MKRITRGMTLKKSLLPAAIFAIAFAAAWYITKIRYERGHEFMFATFYNLVHFKASTPFQYRLLLPSIAALSDKLAGVFNLQVNVRRFFIATDFISLLLIWLIFSYLIGLFLHVSRSLILALSLFIYVPVYLCILPNAYTLLYPYDIPQVLFFVIGLWMICSGNIKWLFPLFIVASLNRETAIILVPWLLLTDRKRTGLSFSKTLIYATLLCLIWMAIKIILKAEIRNPGDFYQVKFAENMKRLYKLNPGTWLLWGCNSLSLFAVIILFFSRRLIKYAANRLFYFAPPYYCLLLVFGAAFEYRIYADLIPLTALGCVMIGYDLMRKKRSA